MTSVLEQRRDIESQIEGRTLCGRLERNAHDHADDPAQSWRVGQTWHSRTWGELGELVREVATAFVTLGVEAGEAVAIMARNRPEHVVTDLAALHVGATPTTLYDTLPAEQIAYVAGNSDARLAVLEGPEELERWRGVLSRLPQLRHIVLLSGEAPATERVEHVSVLTWRDLVKLGAEAPSTLREETERRRATITSEDVATLIYTSGTTGTPKGVILTHHNCMFEAISLARLGGVPPGLTSVSYLPLAHIAERLLSIYIPLELRMHVYYCPDTKQAVDYIREARPTLFFGVPRVWEKMRTAIVTKLDGEPALARAIAHATIRAGEQRVDREQQGRGLPLGLGPACRLLDHLVGAKVREGIGLDRCVLTVSSAAPLAPDVARFFHAIGVPVVEVYGETETTGVATGNRPGAARIGTVGKPLDGVEVQLGKDGEVLVRGPNCTRGYRGLPEQTEELLDPDGWLHTGDIGAFDADGYLTIVDRKKELIVTAGGKNIAPSHIESLLKEHPLVGQALAFGDQRPYITALVVLDEEHAPAWAQEHGLEVTTVQRLAEHEAVRAEIDKAVAAANERLSHAEQIKRYAVLATEWTADSEELTPTLKLKRRIIHEKYQHEIDALYASR